MGVDARLLISNRWNLEDIKDILQHHQNIKAKIESKVSIASAYFQLVCDNGRMINCHYDYQTPLGGGILLSLRSNPQGIEILREIAKVTGGFLNETDIDENYDLIDGLLWEEDGLPYHYKYATTHNEIESNDDIDGLVASVKKWCKRYKQTR